MTLICEKCGDTNDLNSAEQCPQCGTFYANVLDKLKYQREARLIKENKIKAKQAAQQEREQQQFLKGKYFCVTCEHTGKPRTFTRGSIFIEIILWLCFLVPGLIYSIWRLTSKCIICASCGNPDIIPTDSPRAKKLMEESA